tara:strand:- start:651 stop:1817 length:1167 start_codon:yes stop_codon:yes gene_type:complete
MSSPDNLSAIILARSGSKGIFNKNIQEIHGTKLLEFSIKAAIQSKSITNVYVSSDSEEYLKIARINGAKTIKRPKNLSADDSSSEDGILHSITEIEKKEGAIGRDIIFIQCTSPFTSSKDFDKAYKKYIDNKYDSLFSGVKNHGFLWDSNLVSGINHNERELRKRRQDVNVQVLENGAFYIFQTKKFKEMKNRFIGKIGYFLQSEINKYEIDTYEDLEINRFIFHKFILEKNSIDISKIKLIVLDFDGVLTDNLVETNARGTETVKTSKSDSLALSNFRKKFPAVPFIVLSSEKNNSVFKRCQKLNLECFQVDGDKKVFLDKYFAESKIDAKNVIYLGNDVNDLTSLQFVGYPVIVSNSDISLFKYNFRILKSNGGNGALKELLNLLK